MSKQTIVLNTNFLLHTIPLAGAAGRAGGPVCLISCCVCSAAAETGRSPFMRGSAIYRRFQNYGRRAIDPSYSAMNPESSFRPVPQHWKCCCKAGHLAIIGPLEQEG